MHSPLGTLTIAWAAVYGYVCFYYFALWLRRRGEREYLWFALLCGSLAITAVGGGLLADAETLEEGGAALAVKAVGLALASACLIEFVRALTGRGSRAVVIAGFALAAVTLGVVASGQFTVPGLPAPRPTWGFSFAPDYPEPALSPLGAVLGVLTWAAVGLAFAPTPEKTEREPKARLVLVATAASLVAFAHDIFIHVGSLRDYYLVEHTALFAVFAMSRLLIDRLERTRDALEVRERELVLSYAERRETEEALVKKEQLAAVGAFSGVIASEVRKPLEAIRDATAGLGRDADSEERNAVLVSVDAQVERLNRLVNDILTYARPVSAEMLPIDVGALVDAALARIDSLGDAYGVNVIEREGAKLQIHGDPDLLRRAIDSVVDAAVTAMPGGGKLQITIEPAEVSDEPAVSLRFAFEGAAELVPARTTPTASWPAGARGLNLGLAIVERVAQVHGGRLLVDGSDRETSLTLMLPIGRASARPRGGAEVVEARQ